ncbi:MAG: hypothetical protein IT169_16525 [Bryobacterales bacterium]|nr:hypothetical protein [Bryobacterales bacterium]
MLFRRFLSLVGAVAVLAAAVSAQSQNRVLKPLVCGTSPATQRQEEFLHRRATERRAALLRAGRTSIAGAGRIVDLQRNATAVSGDILLMSTGAGVSLARNPFPETLVNRGIQFRPANAAATAYQLDAPAETAYREDALLPPAINLIQAGQPESFTDDDAREFALPFPFPFYGKTYNTIFVNSNGFLSFEEASPAGSNLEYSDFLSGPPKIMGAGLDLDPSLSPAGAGIYVFITDSEAIFSWVKVSQYISQSLQVDFQVRLATDGSIRIFHRRAPLGLFVMGISPGHNAGATDLISFAQPPSQEQTGSIAEIFSDVTNGEIDIARAAQVFFQSQPDDYDYLVFYNNLGIPAGQGVVAYEITVRNQVSGNGDELTDRSEVFGSKNRMQAVLNLGPLSQYPQSPTDLVAARAGSEDTPLTVLAHEAGHRFLAFPLLEEPGGITWNLLGRGDVHWSSNFNSGGSFLEGNAISSTGKLDEFVTGAPNTRYSEVDRYLMGLIGREAVGIEQQLYYVDTSASRLRAPRRGQFLFGPARNFSIFNIIAANGPRIPDHTVSQKRFRFAFVLITNDATAPQADLDKLNGFRTAFESFFREKTANLAIADTSLKPGLSANVFPAAGLIPGAQGQLEVRRAVATSSELPLRIEVTGDAVTAPAAAVIPANAASVTIAVNAANTGVSPITISATDGSYLPETVNMAVRNVSELQLAVVSGTRYQAPLHGETTTPVTVHVSDGNRLPYEGVEVRLEPSTGGSANPPVAFTDARGEATFRWTVGDGDPNRASVFLAANRGSSEKSLIAVEALVPKVLAATNGASFTAGVSPGSLATLFGVSLGAGQSAEASSQPLPIELAGTSVTVNGVRAALLFVNDLQINFVTPLSNAGDTARIVVETAEGVSSVFEAPLLASDPAIFFDSGSNVGAVLRSGSGEKTDRVPALPGAFVEIFATGLGPLLPGGRGVPPRTEMPVSATIDGQPMLVDYAGVAPGFVGLYQVNAKVPEDLAPGVYALRLHQGGKESNSVNVIVGSR